MRIDHLENFIPNNKKMSSSITIHYSNAYAFLVGLFLGNLTNFVSDLMIGGLLLYIVNPEIFTIDRVNSCKDYVWAWIKPPGYSSVPTIEQHPVQSRPQNGNTVLLTPLPRIETVLSPKPKK